MMDFVQAETPEMIQHQEEWVNRTLRAGYPGASVCLHADRTTTTDRPDPLGSVMITVECDYCPAVAVGLNVVPNLVAWYFSSDEMDYGPGSTIGP